MNDFNKRSTADDVFAIDAALQFFLITMLLLPAQNDPALIVPYQIHSVTPWFNI